MSSLAAFWIFFSSEASTALMMSSLGVFPSKKSEASNGPSSCVEEEEENVMEEETDLNSGVRVELEDATI